jgi:DNA-binding NtrC family response regulator
MADSILVVEDEPSSAEYLKLLLEQMGYEVRLAANGVEALLALETGHFDLVISDLRMPSMDGFELLSHLGQRWPDLPAIVLTGNTDVEDIVEAVRLGAVNYLLKPATPGSVGAAVERALLVRKRKAVADSAVPELVGTSKAMVEVRDRVVMAARSDVHVLVTGETGTGKELVSRAIHRHSGLSQGPFVAHNCALSPPDLFESEFFGHRRGSFTGADRDRRGLLREAHEGVLFLDELETLDLGFQAKLLRVIDDGEVRPALSQRRDDIPLLVAHFDPDPETGLTPEAMEALCTASLPGNVRQLRNLVQGARAAAGPAPIGVRHLPIDLAASRPAEPGEAGPEGVPRGMSLRELERRAIVQALEDCDGNRTRAAQLLEIDRSTLRRKLKEYGIEA